MLKYLLDTNILIYVMKRRPIEVLGVFNENAGRMAMSAITLSELHHGAEKSTRVAQNLAAVDEISSLLQVLPYGAKASQHYGQIRSALEKAGTPVSAKATQRGHGPTDVEGGKYQFCGAYWRVAHQASK